MFARAAFLLRALRASPPSEHVEFVREVYRRGDFLEQAALLQALILVPDPARFVNIAVESRRTNVSDVFEAIACENRYPAAHFADANFNQLVIKAFFTGLLSTALSDWSSASPMNCDGWRPTMRASVAPRVGLCPMTSILC